MRYFSHAGRGTPSGLLSSAELTSHFGMVQRSSGPAPATVPQGRQAYGRVESAAAAAHGAAAQDGVVVRPAAAGAHRRAHHRLVRVRPVRRPASHAGGHRSLPTTRSCGPLRLQRSQRGASRTGAWPATRPAPSGSTTSPTWATASSPPTRWPTCWRRTASMSAAPAACATARSSSWAATSATRRPRARNTRSGCCSPSTGPSRYANPDRKLFAIPGNHDWYDGLNAFDSLFCSSRDRLSNASGNVIGGWQCQQHRSYWALRLPYNWWIWGADIQFSKYLDSSQVNYFEPVAEQMGPQDNLIICLAEPSWMLADLQGQDEEENFFKITTIARAARRARRRRHRRRLAPLQPLLRPRARRALHHVGRRRRLPASHPRAQERHLGALAGDAARRRRPRAGDATGVAPGRGLEGARTTTSASSATPRRPRASSSRPCRTCRTPSSRCSAKGSACAGARRSSRRRPSAIPARAAATSSASATCCFRSSTRHSPSASACSTGSITWEFQNLVTQYHISVRQDRRPRHHHLARGACCGPCRSISSPAIITSISLAVMLGGLYATLVWYVDAVERPRIRRVLTKFFVGTAHFLAHVDGHVHAVAAGGHAQQPDDAADRELARMPSTRSAGSRRRSCAT